jgi:hypothetical protein
VQLALGTGGRRVRHRAGCRGTLGTPLGEVAGQWSPRRLTEAIHPAVSDGEDAEIPRYEQHRRVGSTADVDFWTVKKVNEIEHSHLNYVVQDSKWEGSAAYYLEHSPHVVSFVKNQRAGFRHPVSARRRRPRVFPGLPRGAHERRDADPRNQGP